MANPTVTVEIRSIGSKKVIDTLGKVRKAAKGVTTGVDKLGKATKKATTKLTGFKGKMTELGKSASLALGPLNGVAARLTAFSGLATGASFKTAAFIGALVGTGGLVVAAIRVAKSLDAMRKAAERTGLSIERFQEFQFVASQAGIESDKFTKAMETFARRVGEAQTQSGEAITSFKLLFGTLSKIKDLDTEEALLQTADAFRGLEGTMGGAAIVADIFSKANIKMTKFLNLGRKGIEKLAKQSRDLGLIWKRETVLEATRTTDALDSMGKVIKVNLSRTIVGLLPLLTKMAILIGRLGPIIQENIGKATIALFATLGGLIGLFFGGGLGAVIGLGGGGLFGGLISQADILIEKLESAKRTVGETFGASKEVTLNALDSLISFVKVFQVTNEELDAQNKLFGDLLKELENQGARKSFLALERDVKSITDAFRELSKFSSPDVILSQKAVGQATKFLDQFDLATQQTLADDLGELLAGDLDLATRLGVTLDEIQRGITLTSLQNIIRDLFIKKIATNELAKVFKETRTASEKLELSLKKLDFVFGRIPEDVELLARAASKAKRAFIDVDEGSQLLVRSFQSAGDGMVDAMTTAGDAMEVLRDTARSIVDDILKAFIRLAVVNQILNAAFGLVGPAAFPTIGGGGGGGGGQQAVPRAAHGGSFRVGGFGGPDSQLVSFRATPGEIFTATPVGKVGPGGNIVINMNISTGVAATVRSEVLKLAPVIKSLVRRDIVEASRQGGRFNRALNS